MDIENTIAQTQDSLVFFKNSQGLRLQATLLKLSPFQVTFELYGPPSLLRASEVLSEFKILARERSIYSGQAVVSHLVATDSFQTCQADLQQCWAAPELVSLGAEVDELPAGFGAFLRQWENHYKIRPDYKVVVADLQSFLADLKLWLERVELGLHSLPEPERRKAERHAVEQLAPSTTPALAFFFEKFEVAARQIEPGLEPAHRAFCRRQLHPLLMASPFMHRIYVKPLGYAGDYEMVNMILRDPCEGGSLFAKILNVFILSQIPAIAHRNRVSYLTRKLVEETNRVAHLGRKLRILNLGCGPAKEIQNFLAQHSLSDHTEFDLLDFDEETLHSLQVNLSQIRLRHARRTGLNFIKKSVHQVLKQSGKVQSNGSTKAYDLVYCAGLFDYLNDRTCSSLLEYFYELAAPGGLVVATNVEGQNPIRNIMEYIYEWHLLYRSGPEFAALAPAQAPAEAIRLETEESGGNIFIEIRKPQPAS